MPPMRPELVDHMAANVLAHELRIWDSHGHMVWDILTEEEKQVWRDKVHARLSEPQLPAQWQRQANENSLTETISINDSVGTPEYYEHLRTVTEQYGIVWDEDDSEEEEC